MDTISVLIADGDVAARDGLRSILGAYDDLEVVGQAADGVQAAEEADRLRPDVLVVDAQIPGIGGIKTTRLVNECCPEVAVLVLAVHRGMSVAALAAGAGACLLKDCGREELVRTIRELGRRDV